MSLLGDIANNEIINFLRTTTIKNQYFADKSRQNQLIANMASYVRDRDLPYYKHISGSYILKEPITCTVRHPRTGTDHVFTYGSTIDFYDKTLQNKRVYQPEVFNEMMFVTSIDTGQEIPFTLETLHPEFTKDPTSVHSKTLETYKLPNRYYQLLCERYPSQVDLIKAIVYPPKDLLRNPSKVTLSRFVDEGSDGTGEKWSSLTAVEKLRECLVDTEHLDILSYDTSILDDNEVVDLKAYLQEVVETVKYRWDIKEYTFEENYPMVLWSMIWSILPLALITRRYNNIRTPLAHSSHIWDFLGSKNLEEYKGWFSNEQTNFLHKNAEYLLNNAGKQKVTNILIDKMLTDNGLGLRAKTIVTDTSDTLDEASLTYVEDYSQQCSSCSRATICKKKIQDRKCPDYINLSKLCKAEPCVLTENFNGSSDSKIIAVLVSDYGYTEDQAKIKLNRSRIWRDSDVEAIRSDLDRDQQVDFSGTIETLDDIIQREHESGMEPVYNSDVVKQQTEELRYANGTNSPTKLLEVIRDKRNAKYEAAFSKFLTESLMRFGDDINVYTPKGGTPPSVTAKADHVYNFSLKYDNKIYSLPYRDLLSLFYLGTIRQNKYDCIYDYVNDDTEIKGDHTYFGIPPTVEVPQYVNTNYVPVTKYVDEDVKKPIKDELYRWMPKYVSASYFTITDKIEIMPMITGHAILTDISTRANYDIPIPNQIKVTNAFKFGRPVILDELVKAWHLRRHAADTGGTEEVDIDPTCVYDVQYENLLNELVSNEELDLTTTSIHVLYLHETLYVVTEMPSDTNDTRLNLQMWEDSGHPIRLMILGIISNETLYLNYSKLSEPDPLTGQTIREEVPIIPSKFRWSCDHMRQEDDVENPEEVPTKKVEYLEMGPDWKFIQTPVKDTVTYDRRTKDNYRLYDTAKYVPLDEFVDGYVSIMGRVSDQKEIGEYLGKMFALKQNMLRLASTSSSVLTNLAVKTVLEACLARGYYTIELTDIPKTEPWPADGSYNSDFLLNKDTRTEVAFYSSWLQSNEVAGSIVKSADNSVAPESVWDEFNVTCLDALTEYCDCQYINSATENNRIEKLKRLVKQLSSYKVAFVDISIDGYTGDDLGDFVSDVSRSEIRTIDTHRFQPYVDSERGPYAGEWFFTLEDNLLVETKDTTYLANKTYYKQTPIYRTQSVAPTVGTDILETIELETLEIDMQESNLPTKVDNPQGNIDEYDLVYEELPIYNLLGLSNDTSNFIGFRKDENGDWWYLLFKRFSSSDLRPGSSLSQNAVVSMDNFLKLGFITEEIRKKLYSLVYKEMIGFNEQVDESHCETGRIVDCITEETKQKINLLLEYLDRKCTGRFVDTVDHINFSNIQELVPVNK